jgi:hypothetical protein
MILAVALLWFDMIMQTACIFVVVIEVSFQVGSPFIE